MPRKLNKSLVIENLSYLKRRWLKVKTKKKVPTVIQKDNQSYWWQTWILIMLRFQIFVEIQKENISQVRASMFVHYRIRNTAYCAYICFMWKMRKRGALESIGRIWKLRGIQESYNHLYSCNCLLCPMNLGSLMNTMTITTNRTREKRRLKKKERRWWWWWCEKT